MNNSSVLIINQIIGWWCQTYLKIIDHQFPVKCINFHKKKYIHKRLPSIIMRLIVVYTVFNRDFFSCSTIYPMQIDSLILIKLNETKKKVYLDCTNLLQEFITSQKWLTRNNGQHLMLIIVILTMLSIVFSRTLRHWMTWLYIVFKLLHDIMMFSSLLQIGQKWTTTYRNIGNYILCQITNFLMQVMLCNYYKKMALGHSILNQSENQKIEPTVIRFQIFVRWTAKESR
jgi:hypothetical protein